MPVQSVCRWILLSLLLVPAAHAAQLFDATPDSEDSEMGAVQRGLFVLTVTSSADSGAGTLRDVLGQANAIAGLNLIQFNITGDCPRLISLSTPLPDITEPVIIDGFSQPGASVNSAENGNNSVLCVGVRAASLSDVPWALRVPPDSNAALKVHGIGFGGFDDGGGLLGEAAIFLQGGSGHEITGSQFSGEFHTTTLAPNAEGVRVMNNATGALIGGSSPALRNTISNSGVAAILILGSTSGNHEIINNYIGTTRSGWMPAGNFDGIRIINSGGNHVLANLISGNTRDGIVISGEQATGNVVGNNRIGDIRAGNVTCGPPPLPPCPVPLTNRKGIFIENGASNNTIGQATSVGGPNRIRYSTQHGIRVISGQQNRILNNSLFDNGTGAGELDIDIDAFGLDSIDVDCGPSADIKANRGQNRPVIESVNEVSFGVLSVTGTLSSCTNSGGFDAVYRLQFFRSDGCAANGHGPGRYFLGDHNVILDGPDESDVTEPFVVELAGFDGQFITATATDIFGNTSEFSQCVQAEESDGLFADRFEQ